MNEEYKNYPSKTLDGGSHGMHRADHKRLYQFRNGLLGMSAEILFACGFILIGFLISLLSGW